MMGYGEHNDALSGMLRRATVEETDDTGTQQMMKKLRGLASERPEDVYRPQPHGITSHPPKGSEGLFLALGGRADRFLALGFEHKEHRPKNLPEGGVALYDMHGKVIKVVKDEIDIDAGGKPVTIRNASVVKIEGAERVSMGAGGRWVVVRPNRVDLGVASPDGMAIPKVVTTGGNSDVVFAAIS